MENLISIELDTLKDFDITDNTESLFWHMFGEEMPLTLDNCKKLVLLVDWESMSVVLATGLRWLHATERNTILDKYEIQNENNVKQSLTRSICSAKEKERYKIFHDVFETVIPLYKEFIEKLNQRGIK